jgi:hypothetical protein
MPAVSRAGVMVGARSSGKSIESRGTPRPCRE